MFTGIITDIGRIRSLEQRGDLRAEILTRYDVDRIDLGASISCNGACLTVVAMGRTDGENEYNGWFAVDISQETLDCTTLSDWQEGALVNLERALRVGEELGGHIVTGHVDAVGTIKEMVEAGDSTRFTFDVPRPFRKFLSPKGSIAINGTSLTVNEVDDDASTFGVNIIPHTKEETIFGAARVGDRINLEADPMIRYTGRLLSFANFESNRLSWKD